VGADAVGGVQGRYFLVAALVCGTLVTRPGDAPSAAAGWLALPVLLFPILGIVIVINRITLRYYF
jgi:hypothetical protein